MAHYALLDENNIVTSIIVGRDENDTEDLPNNYNNWEEVYENLYSQTCKRTSYNTVGNQHLLDKTPYRGNYAGIGYTYDEENDVFYAPQPYPSWTLNTNWVWEAPVAYPDNENIYKWNEANQSWDLQE